MPVNIGSHSFTENVAVLRNEGPGSRVQNRSHFMYGTVVPEGTVPLVLPVVRIRTAVLATRGCQKIISVVLHAVQGNSSKRNKVRILTVTM